MKSKVALVRVNHEAGIPEVTKAVNNAIKMIGGPGKYCAKGEVVLVKPNFGSIGNWCHVNPSVAYATLKVFSQYGCRALVGEDPSVNAEEESVYESYKVYEIARKSGAEAVSLRNGPHKIVSVPRPSFFREIEASSYALDARLVISVAKMKTVNLCHVSLSLKNMKGVVTPKWKRKFHCEGLNQAIVDLNRIIRPGLAVIDGTQAADMNTRTVRPVGLILASNDCVAVDAVCTRIMGFDPKNVEHIVLAEKANLGTADLDKIEILGEKFENFEGKFTFSPPVNPFDLADESEGRIHIIQGNPCSSCLNEIGSALGSFREHLKEFEDLAILVGPDAKMPNSKKHLIIIGNCLQRYRNEGIYVPGCPPFTYQSFGTASNLERARYICIEDALSKVLKEVADSGK